MQNLFEFAVLRQKKTQSLQISGNQILILLLEYYRLQIAFFMIAAFIK